jgi:SAM-dependent methyltransferase
MWDDEAQTFDEAADHGLADPTVREAWRTLLLGLLPPAPARIADLGCGTGTLSLLLAEAGYAVDGVDFSPEMVARAHAKAGDLCTFTLGDADRPPRASGAYDVVLSRHVLWAMPSPADAVRRWIDLLVPGGRLVLVEGHRSTGAGRPAEQTVALVEATGRDAELTRQPEAAYWGREIDDDRYVVVGRG